MRVKIYSLIFIKLLCFLCAAVVQAVDVNEESWVNFRSVPKSDSTSKFNLNEDRCLARVLCNRLHRVTVRCDTVLPRDACGKCLPGFLDADDTIASCALERAATADGGVGISAALTDDGIADELAKRQSDSGAGEQLQLKARADTAAAPNRSEASSSKPGPHPANDDFVFYTIVGSTTAAGLLLIIIAAICWYKHSSVSKANELDYKDTNTYKHSSGNHGDGKLAQSAHMYHYQHQKQQMIAMEKSNGTMKRDSSDADSDLDNEEADYTVYECPGLASTGEMEVRNPMFRDEAHAHTAAAAAAGQGGAPADAGVGK